MNIKTAVRCMGVVAVSSWWFPDAGVFLRRLSSLLLSTPTVFLLANAIVLTLFFRPNASTSDHFTPKPNDPIQENHHHQQQQQELMVEQRPEESTRCYRRIKSELRRSVTDVGKEEEDEEEEKEEDELRRRVEDFIAKQLRSQREELTTPLITFN